MITDPPHSSSIFQVVDVLLFERFKAAKKHFVRDTPVSASLDQVRRGFRADGHATTNTIVRGSWGKAGLGFTQ
jgi:hypothetical protein